MEEDGDERGRMEKEEKEGIGEEMRRRRRKEKRRGDKGERVGDYI